ncbi:signal recognition particle-docking protein FtsY [bacterium SCSIO 12696]|nr:signal recognition particle-docking protein FtsY [bacterium SCSIO 12696]
MSDNEHSAAASGDSENSKKGGLFGRFRRKSEVAGAAPADNLPSDTPSADSPQPMTAEKPKVSFRERMRRALARTGSGIGSLFMGRKVIDEELLDELETQLLMADVGVETTADIIANLTDQLKRSELKDSAALQAALQRMLQDVLVPCEQPLACDTQADGPFILLVVGVNGVGKTTTIGKLAKRLQGEGKSVMLAAGDTFRAAAVEQLQAWGERNQVPVVAQHTGADSASVIFDAIQSARAKNVDVIIADTAGRLHNKSNLMEELKKVQRVIAKLDDSAPHEVLLVLDAGTGQNALSQMQQFHDAVEVSGIALTKLDGTAKGGIAFALARRFGAPIRFIGVGEGADDLQPFVAAEFVSALLASETSIDD